MALANSPANFTVDSALKKCRGTIGVGTGGYKEMSSTLAD
jgi:hypothetical protein